MDKAIRENFFKQLYIMKKDFLTPGHLSGKASEGENGTVATVPYNFPFITVLVPLFIKGGGVAGGILSH